MSDLSPVSYASVARHKWPSTSTRDLQTPPTRVYLDHGASIPAQRLAALRDRFEALIQDQTENVIVNGAHDNRLPGASSLTFNGVDADALIARLPDLDLSAASACHSGTPEPSHVLRAIGLGDEQAYAILRVVFGRSTTCADMEYAVHRIGETVRVLRAACERTK